MTDDAFAQTAADLGVTITRLQPRIGAEIGGVDFREPPTGVLRDLLRTALFKYRVIFFRDQKITPEQFIAVGRAFGELESTLVGAGKYPELFPVVTKADDMKIPAAMWHTDVTCRPAPPMGAMLRGITVPPLGGDTLWSCAAAAYEGLDEETKRRIETLRAEHNAVRAFDHSRLDRPDERARLARGFPPISHPVVIIHPETGERLLFVNINFTSHIVGMEPEESGALLNKLYAQFHKPEHQVRFKWRPNSIAFWDERATHHYAVPGFEGTPERIMERITIVGTPPVGAADGMKRSAA